MARVIYVRRAGSSGPWSPLDSETYTTDEAAAERAVQLAKAQPDEVTVQAIVPGATVLDPVRTIGRVRRRAGKRSWTILWSSGETGRYGRDELHPRHLPKYVDAALQKMYAITPYRPFGRRAPRWFAVTEVRRYLPAQAQRTGGLAEIREVLQAYVRAGKLEPYPPGRSRSGKLWRFGPGMLERSNAEAP